ncbi:MAG: 5'-nucleotidase, lipoprotein e(P4) family, partial [Thermoanaerobaculia bacterium]
MRIRFLFAAVLASGCINVSAPPRPAPAPTPAPAPAPAAEPEPNRADHRLLYATLWLQTAAEYRAAALQTFTTAGRAVEDALADPVWTAAVEQETAPAGLPPAVIVDIDETVLDNSPYEARLIRDRETFSGETWNAWVEERAALAVPGAVEFAREAAARGVTVFYVSNRDASAELATRENLRAAGFPLDRRTDVVLLRGERGWTESDKSARRAAVASTHRILLLVGDDLGDFLPNVRVSRAERDALVSRYEEKWGTSWFVVPNPMYGSWERAILEGAEDPD